MIIKDSYKTEYNKLHEEGIFKYTIIGSPEHQKWIEIAQADTFYDLWNQLIMQNEIDMERYERDHEIYNVEIDIFYIPKPECEMGYRRAINQYLKTDRNYYYNKSNI